MSNVCHPVSESAKHSSDVKGILSTQCLLNRLTQTLLSEVLVGINGHLLILCYTSVRPQILSHLVECSINMINTDHIKHL